MIRAVLVTSISGLAAINVIVGSLPVSPSAVTPSSEMSLTTVPSGAIPVAVAVLERPPASTIS